MPDSPILCLWTPHPETHRLDAQVAGVPDGVTLFRAGNGVSAVSALRACIKAHPGCDLVLLSADAQLPPAWWARLCASRDSSFDVLSPSSDAVAALDPFEGTARPSRVEDADACVWMLGEVESAPCEPYSSACSLWRASALSALTEETLDGEVPPGVQAAVLTSLYVQTGVKHAGRSMSATPAAIALLRERIAALAGRIPSAVGRDEQPVMLHVLHGWGGGVQHFVESLMSASDGWRHLALVAHGNSAERIPGERLALFDDLSAPPIAEWPLSPGVRNTSLASTVYQETFANILGRFRVRHVLVSSMIGHGISALRTGLPTAVVCHDYYPLWPKLHEDFGDRDRDFSADAIEAAMIDPGEGFAFSETRASAWRALREDYVKALLDVRASLFYPSLAVHENLLRIEPRLATLTWHHIPHGLAAWSVPVHRIDPPPRAALRVLVLGRINGGKGEVLLRQLLPLLDSRIELVLLGAGRAGMRFFGRSGVHVRMEYRREELPELIAHLAPDLALMPVTVAETFSYTLSELWSLGVPVLATRLGSLVERIVDGENGLLVAPEATAVAARLSSLLAVRESLTPLRQPHPQPTLAQMAHAYEAHWPTAPRAGLVPVRGASVLMSQQINVLDLARRRMSHELDVLHGRMRDFQAEIKARGDWADGLQRLLDDRTEWASSLQRDLDAAVANFLALREEFEERSKWAMQLNEDLHASRQAHAQLMGVLDASRTDLASAMAHGEAMQRDRDLILASRSWRWTRPLRFAHRVFASWLAKVRFRLGRARSLVQRTKQSLRSRGVHGTASRIRDELRQSKPPKTLPLPIPSVDVADAALRVPTSDAPFVSVVIPVYNHLETTLVCLRSLAATTNRLAHEIIVVDDCSSDASAEVLPKIEGLHYQRNPQNLGFIGACNAGAASARGQFVVFLNNDTAVQDGWLDALLDTFDQHRDVGLVGSKLVYPDGRLQEAGGIVFADGSGWNYGRFDDPGKPEYNFVREVDYCSGAAIALRTELFRQFGGFDAYYAPAYYEDTDLAMKVRQAGLRVLYQPASVVVHFEGISSGTDLTSGTKRYQVVNKEKFLERWKDALACHPSPELATHEGVVLARQHRRKKHVLVIDATTPQPDHDSGSVRLCNVLRLFLEEGCAVTFFADNRAYVERYSAALQQMGVEVLWHPHLSDPVDWFQRNGKRLDLVFVSRHYIATNYVALVRTHALGARLAFDTVDLHYLREQRAAELAGSVEMARTAEKTRAAELALIAASDVTLVVSPVEKDLLAREAPSARVEILSNVHEVFGCRRGFEERRGIWFVGGYQHPPNVDAALWFAHEILPLVRQQLPDLVFHVVGSKAPPEVKALAELPGVNFHGFVNDIEPFLDGCRLAVAPLRYGAGVKGKVNMSMSYGQPVVATPIAVEGMFAEAERDVLVAEEPQAFAAAVVRAYQDEGLWTALSQNGLANVERHFSFEAARAQVRTLIG